MLKLYFFLLTLDLVVPFRFESLRNALRRGFSVDDNMFFYIFILLHGPSRLRKQCWEQGELRQGCGCLAVWPAPGAAGVLPWPASRVTLPNWDVPVRVGWEHK